MGGRGERPATPEDVANKSAGNSAGKTKQPEPSAGRHRPAIPPEPPFAPWAVRHKQLAPWEVRRDQFHSHPGRCDGTSLAPWEVRRNQRTASSWTRTKNPLIKSQQGPDLKTVIQCVFGMSGLPWGYRRRAKGRPMPTFSGDSAIPPRPRRSPRRRRCLGIATRPAEGRLGLGDRHPSAG